MDRRHLSWNWRRRAGVILGDGLEARDPDTRGSTMTSNPLRRVLATNSWRTDHRQSLVGGRDICRKMDRHDGSQQTVS